MKRLFILLSAAAVIFSAPQIHVDQPTKDFGVVEEGQTVFKHTFEIKNTGTDTLRIQKVKPGCSCTIVDFPEVIAPGKSGEIASSLKVKKSGNYSKSIKVYTNSKNNPIETLRLKVEVLSIVNTDNRYLMLQEDSQNTYASSIIVSTKAKDFKILKSTYQKRGDTDNEIKEIPFTVTSLPSMKESFYKKWDKKLLQFNELKKESLLSIFDPQEVNLEKPLAYYEQLIESKASKNNAMDQAKLVSLKDAKEKLITQYRDNAPTKSDLIHTSISEHLRQLKKDYALGYKKYRLDFKLIVELEFSEPGTFTFITNVPEKQELKLPCILEPARKK